MISTGSLFRTAIPMVPAFQWCQSVQDWRAKFGTTDASMMSEINAITEQNHRLKRIYAKMSMQNTRLQKALGKQR